MTAFQHNSDSVPDNASGKMERFGQDLAVAAREHPISTALIGMGVLWLFSGGGRTSILGGAADVGRSVAGLGSGLRTIGSAAAPLGSTLASGFDAAVGGVTSAGSTGAATAADALSGASSYLSDAFSSASEGLGSAAHRAREMTSRTGEMMSPIQQGLADLWQRQPLVLGAIGLAIGAGLAASLPQTSAERRVFGESADVLRAKAQEFASEQAANLEGAVRNAADEATKQGLTPRGAMDALGEVGGKLAGVAKAAGDSA